ncbi:Dystrophin [Trichinella spiralis]|uniref:Dystrophin n=1 Tax=Trichinella spiralis TaxID=6334 RepID=A0ABR3KNN1_TRISP
MRFSSLHLHCAVADFVCARQSSKLWRKSIPQFAVHVRIKQIRVGSQRQETLQVFKKNSPTNVSSVLSFETV